MRTVFVANPRAGSAFWGRGSRQLRDLVRAHIPHAEWLFTERAGHASGLAAEAVRSGAELVVAVGGDGTLSDVVHGVRLAGGSAAGPHIGLLPSGSGGDFRRLLTAQAAGAAIEALSNPRCHVIDVGELSFTPPGGQPTTRTFLNVLTFGLGGIVDRYVNQSSKPLGGSMAYLGATLRAIATFEAPLVELIVDGQPVGQIRVASALAANGRFVGGGMCVAPGAQLADGMFDIVALEHRPPHAALPVLAAVYRGKHIGRSGVHHWRGRVLEARAVDAIRCELDVDGENLGALPIRTECISRAISFASIAPEHL